MVTIDRRGFLRLGGGAAFLVASGLGWAIERYQAQAGGSLITLGTWPGSDGDLYTYESWLGRKFNVFRARGNNGRMDTPIVKASVAKAAAEGRRASLELDPRILVDGVRRAVPYSEILGGKWDDTIRAKIPAVKALPGGPHYFEFHSEADNQGHTSANPYAGTADEFKACYEYVRALFDAEGVTNLRWMVVLTAPVYGGNKGGPVAWMPSAWCHDIVGVDGYSRPATTGKHKSFATIFGPALAYARSVGKPMWVDETGCQEDPNDPTFKANWYLGADSFLRDNAQSIEGVVWTGDKEWAYNTSAQALKAFKAIGGDGIWWPQT